MKSEKIEMDGVNKLYKTDGLYLAGQPNIESLSELKKIGITKVINLRSLQEADFSEEESKVKELGMDYISLPIMKDGALDRENSFKLNDLISDNDKFFIHCGSANRVGGWFITYLVQKKNIDFEKAIEIAMESGLQNPAFVDQAHNILNDEQ